ncbi:uncharacterized protein F4807DRAFT_6375 [Annulohypoxylon truncatum]|uniref:uncharacterized protein n=1 Tax=Annulohypoxylon truncatum TaxID=327061 RepID=UPI0020079515|nr:uncharacterized protein F4807DRAFT_6375 [Annulohypoxylon truncatum]KAI1214692.1 hypothetical protein F4807DRAFT_6375 [Annulohypoxylon truncatum]
MVVRFCYPNQKLRLKSSSCDKLVESIIQQLPGPFHTRILVTLRQTSRLLEDFYIFEMKSIGSRYQDSAGYGISSQRIQPGDIMIPLWNMNWKDERFMSDMKGYLYLRTKTMLVVRRTQGQSSEEPVFIPGGKQQVETGRIVGWAVCVLLKHKSAFGYDLSVDTMWDDDSDGEQQCSMRLI